MICVAGGQVLLMHRCNLISWGPIWASGVVPAPTNQWLHVGHVTFSVTQSRGRNKDSRQSLNARIFVLGFHPFSKPTRTTGLPETIPITVRWRLDRSPACHRGHGAEVIKVATLARLCCPGTRSDNRVTGPAAGPWAAEFTLLGRQRLAAQQTQWVLPWWMWLFSLHGLMRF